MNNTNILVSDRFNQLVNALGMNVLTFAKELGYDRADKFYNISNGKYLPSFEILSDITNKFESVNIKWLINGVGDMFIKDEIEPHIKKDEISVYGSNKNIDRRLKQQLIPIYNIEAAAGLTSLFNDFAKYTPIDYISLPNLGKVDGGLYACGDSMYPLIKSGDIVVFRQIQDIWNSIFWGEMYLLSYDLEGEEYIVIKYIQKSSKEDYITLASQNPHHAPKDIPIKHVRALAQVKASVRFNVIRNTF